MKSRTGEFLVPALVNLILIGINISLYLNIERINEYCMEMSFRLHIYGDLLTNFVDKIH